MKSSFICFIVAHLAFETEESLSFLCGSAVSLTVELSILAKQTIVQTTMRTKETAMIVGSIIVL